jgi:nucleotide sugar dehydrogenase
MKVAVVGLGKIGLPLAAQFALRGNHVFGIDIDERVVASVNAGIEPFPGEADLQRRLAELAGTSLVATSDFGLAIPDADAVVVVVPLVVDADGQPDFGALDAATASIGAHLTPRTLVAYETTLPVGTTRSRWKPRLEAASGLVEGRDFHLVFSPERVLTGRVFADLRRYPKLIGALTPEGAAVAQAFYESVLEFDDRPDLPRANGIWDMGSPEAAELAKLAETTYRDVNIGLVNQFARFADSVGVDIYRVIDACNSQPYSHLHRPGVAVGGHCIPVYPRLYLSSDPQASIVASARGANEAMPAYAVSLLASEYGDLAGAKVVVLGAAYRGGVKETAFSGVRGVVDALAAQGAIPVVHDPLFSADELVEMGYTPHTLPQPVDAAILQADHDEYLQLTSADLPGIRVLVDGRAVTDASRWPGVIRRVIGSP